MGDGPLTQAVSQGTLSSERGPESRILHTHAPSLARIPYPPYPRGLPARRSGWLFSGCSSSPSGPARPPHPHPAPPAAEPSLLHLHHLPLSEQGWEGPPRFDTAGYRIQNQDEGGGRRARSEAIGSPDARKSAHLLLHLRANRFLLQPHRGTDLIDSQGHGAGEGEEAPKGGDSRASAAQDTARGRHEGQLQDRRTT